MHHGERSLTEFIWRIVGYVTDNSNASLQSVTEAVSGRLGGKDNYTQWECKTETGFVLLHDLGTGSILDCDICIKPRIMYSRTNKKSRYSLRL